MLYVHSKWFKPLNETGSAIGSALGSALMCIEYQTEYQMYISETTTLIQKGNFSAHSRVRRENLV